jgi:hypothetical protein
MAGSVHGSACTTPRVRAELQASQETISTLAQRYGLSRTTASKWRVRTTTDDAPMGPSAPHSTVLTLMEDAMVVEFRRRTLLPPDDVLGCLRDSIPKLTRSSLHRCLERHGISRLPENPDRGTNGQAERMNRTVKDATIKAFHYPDLDSLKAHVLAFVSALTLRSTSKHSAGRRPSKPSARPGPARPTSSRADPRSQWSARHGCTAEREAAAPTSCARKQASVIVLTSYPWSQVAHPACTLGERRACRPSALSGQLMGEPWHKLGTTPFSGVACEARGMRGSVRGRGGISAPATV